MSKTILIIEDEEAIQGVVKAFLEDEGYNVVLASDGLEGMEKFCEYRPDLILLDLMLPKMNGFTVCETIRKKSRIPIIMLTALDDDASQMKGFDALADDYITKPFETLELLARVEVVLRRRGGGVRVLTYGPIVQNLDSHTVTLDGELVPLAPKEFELLRLLSSRPGVALTRDEILQAVWDYDYTGETRTVDMHVKALRQKLGEDVITTVRGRPSPAAAAILWAV